MIWSIGAIAANGYPGALDLFRKILRACFLSQRDRVDVHARHKHPPGLQTLTGVTATC